MTYVTMSYYVQPFFHTAQTKGKDQIYYKSEREQYISFIKIIDRDTAFGLQQYSISFYVIRTKHNHDER